MDKRKEAEQTQERQAGVISQGRGKAHSLAVWLGVRARKAAMVSIGLSRTRQTETDNHGGASSRRGKASRTGAVPMMTLVKDKMCEKPGQGSAAQGFSTAGGSLLRK